MHPRIRRILGTALTLATLTAPALAGDMITRSPGITAKGDMITKFASAFGHLVSVIAGAF